MSYIKSYDNVCEFGPWSPPWMNSNSGGARLQASPNAATGGLAIFTKKCFFLYANGWIVSKLKHDGPQAGLHPGCAQRQGRGQRSHDTSTFGISQKSLLLPGKWLHPDQTQSFPNFAFPLIVQFSSTSKSPNGCEFAL